MTSPQYKLSWGQSEAPQFLQRNSFLWESGHVYTDGTPHGIEGLSIESHRHIIHSTKSLHWVPLKGLPSPKWMHTTLIIRKQHFKHVWVNFLFIHQCPDWHLWLPEGLSNFPLCVTLYETSCPKNCLSFIYLVSLLKHQVLEVYELSVNICVFPTGSRKMSPFKNIPSTEIN